MILTSLVAERADWARALIGRPGVPVASGLDAVLSIVAQLVAQPGPGGPGLHRQTPA